MEAKSRVVLSLLTVALSLTASVADAGCITGPHQLMWQYPADGSTDVPTNANIWAVTTMFNRLGTATLNGEELEPVHLGYDGGSYGRQRAVFESPELLPNTDYTVTFTIEGGYEPTSLTTTFTTGDGPEQTTLHLDIEGVEVHTGVGPFTEPPERLSRYGAELMHSVGCFDVSPFVVVEAQITSNALVTQTRVRRDMPGSWLGTPSTYWPEAAGNPHVVIGPSQDVPTLCVLVTAFDIEGNQLTHERCVEQEGPEPETQPTATGADEPQPMQPTAAEDSTEEPEEPPVVLSTNDEEPLEGCATAPGRTPPAAPVSFVVVGLLLWRLKRSPTAEQLQHKWVDIQAPFLKTGTGSDHKHTSSRSPPGASTSTCCQDRYRVLPQAPVLKIGTKRREVTARSAGPGLRWGPDQHTLRSKPSCPHPGRRPSRSAVIDCEYPPARLKTTPA